MRDQGRVLRSSVKPSHEAAPSWYSCRHEKKRKEKKKKRKEKRQMLKDHVSTNVSPPHPYFLVSLLAYRLKFASGISSKGCGS